MSLTIHRSPPEVKHLVILTDMHPFDWKLK